MPTLNNAVVLIRPPQIASKYSLNAVPVPPIGLAYIAGHLKAKDIEVKLIDSTGLHLNNFYTAHRPYMRVEGLTTQQVIELIPEHTEIIGISAMFSQEWVFNRAFIQDIKNSFPQSIIIIGGEHATSLPEYCLRDCPEVDFVVLGEGEEIFYNICNSHKQGKPIENLEGIAFINSDGIFTQLPRAKRMTLPSALPTPDWNDVPLEDYFNRSLGFGPSFGRSMPILATRGCPYQCTFCSSPNTWTTRYVAREPQELIEEIRKYKEKYNIDGLQFYDLTMIIKKSWIHDFCRLLIKEFPNMKWSPPIGTRSEALDSDTINLMIESGCSYLAYAPESGSEASLSRVKKKLKLENISKSIRHSAKSKQPTKINLIIGFPDDSRKDIYLTLLYGLKAAVWGVDDCSFNMFYAYPGSEIFYGFLKDNKLKLDDDYFDSLTSHWELFAFSRRRTYSNSIPTIELIFYRFFGLISFYSISYLSHPQKIIRLIKNILTNQSSSTMEQRIKVFLTRRIELFKRIF